MSSTDTTDPTPQAVYPERPRTPETAFEKEPLSPDEVLRVQALRQAFEARFPPLPLDRSDVLILSWAEIERQFLDLCAPWDPAGSLLRDSQGGPDLAPRDAGADDPLAVHPGARGDGHRHARTPLGLGRWDPHALSPAGLIGLVLAGATGLTVIFALLMQCLVMIQTMLERA